MKIKKNNVFFVIMFFCSIGYVNAQASKSYSDLIAERLRISGIIDSLELVKQTLKRQGKSIADIDEEYQAYRQQASLLRKQITDYADNSAEPDMSEEKKILFPEHKSSFLSKYFPTDSFNWLVIAVGALAVISSVVLVFGLISAIFGRKKTAHPRNPIVDPPTKRKPLPKRPDNFTVNENRGNADIIDKDSLRNIRDRMTDGIEQIQRFNPAPSNFPKPQTPRPPVSQTPEQNISDNTGDFKQKIIQAYRSGLDVNEISRRFKVSADQVSLILRVANNDTRRL